MALSTALPPDRVAFERTGGTPVAPAVDGSAHASGVSWGAIFAGAAGAAALSLILLILGTGLGLSSVSPWSQAGITATTFGVSTILWITLTQLVASGMGGYLAGRLRTRWSAVHVDEVYFRDTAHGFLAWAIASLATAALLGSVIGSIVSNGAQAGAAVAGGAVTAAAGSAAGMAASSDRGTSNSNGMSNPAGYYVDTLFRKDPSATATDDRRRRRRRRTARPRSPRPRASSPARSKSGSLPGDDAHYLGQVVAQRTGLSQADAEKRVNDAFARMQAAAKEAQASAMEAADKARKASAYGALWLFVSLLIGAFAASLAATYGGRRRDA